MAFSSPKIFVRKQALREMKRHDILLGTTFSYTVVSLFAKEKNPFNGAEISSTFLTMLVFLLAFIAFKNILVEFVLDFNDLLQKVSFQFSSVAVRLLRAVMS